MKFLVFEIRQLLRLLVEHPVENEVDQCEKKTDRDERSGNTQNRHHATARDV